jgi:flagellin
MRINTNISAMNAHRQLAANTSLGAKAMEKLSSGLRINRAGDDAAGLAISEKMRGQIRGLNQATRNAQDGISMIQTAEGALNETHAILQRMRELAVQASNDTMQAADRTAIGEELKALTSEIDRIGNTTQFNGKNLLNGTLSTSYDLATSTAKVGSALATATNVTIAEVKVDGAVGGTTYTFSANGANLTLTGGGKNQTLTVGAMTDATTQVLNFSDLGVSVKLVSSANIAGTATNIATDLNTKTIVTAAGSTSATFAIGANSGQTMNVSFADMRAAQLGQASNLNTLIGTVAADSVIDTVAKAQTLITEIDGAIVDVSTQRGVLGAAQNRLEHTINNLGTSAENLQAAESRIRDVDMAAEMMEFTKFNILNQAATAMLAQANIAPSTVLQLLG